MGVGKDLLSSFRKPVLASLCTIATGCGADVTQEPERPAFYLRNNRMFEVVDSRGVVDTLENVGKVETSRSNCIRVSSDINQFPRNVLFSSCGNVSARYIGTKIDTVYKQNR